MRTTHQILAKSLAGVEHDGYIENYRLQELDEALQRFLVQFWQNLQTSQVLNDFIKI